MIPKIDNVAVFVADTEPAQKTYKKLSQYLNIVALDKADMAIAIGGDGLMLKSLHKILMNHKNIPIYGINRGSYGFLMNSFDDHLSDQETHALFENAEGIKVYPLMMKCTDTDGKIHCHYAINEVSVFRLSAQIAKLRIIIDGQVRMEELWCDGVIIATPAGSTAYNYAAYGSIIPLEAKVLALTPVAPARPPRWRGALLNHKSNVEIQIKDNGKRPISAVADNVEIMNVVSIEISEDRSKPLTLLFNPDANLADRILKQQFVIES